MEGRNPQEFHDSTDALNQQAKLELLAEAAKERQLVIDLAFESLKLFLRRDTIHLRRMLILDEENRKDEELPLYILDDTITDPTHPDRELARVLTMLLVPDQSMGQEDDVFMQISVPIDKETVIDENFDPSTFKKPEMIFVELRGPTGIPANYIIYKYGIEAFAEESATDESVDEIVTEIDAFDERIVTASTRRVDTGLPVVAIIHERMINMVVVPQKRWTYGEPFDRSSH